MHHDGCAEGLALPLRRGETRRTGVGNNFQGELANGLAGRAAAATSAPIAGNPAVASGVHAPGLGQPLSRQGYPIFAVKQPGIAFDFGHWHPQLVRIKQGLEQLRHEIVAVLQTLLDANELGEGGTGVSFAINGEVV